MKLLALYILFWFSLGCYAAQECNLGSLKQSFDQEKDVKKAFVLANDLSECYTFSNQDSARYYVEIALELAKEIDGPEYLSKAFYRYAVIEKTNGNYNASIEYTLKAILYFDAIKDMEGLIESNALIGHNYALRKEYENSIVYYDKSIELADATGKKTLKLGALIGKGNSYYYQDQLEEASKIYEEAITISEKYDAGDISIKAGLYANTGNIFLTNKDYPAAIEKYKKGFELYYKTNNKYGMSLLAYNIGDAFLGINAYDSSLRYFNINLFLGEELASLEEIKYAYKGFTNLYEQQGDFENAFLNYQKYVKYADSIKEFQYSSDVYELTEKYQNAKKQEELNIAKTQLVDSEKLRKQSDITILLLIVGSAIVFVVAIVIFILFRKTTKSKKLIEVQSEQILEKNKYIDKALHQKEILLKEVHHRVKNNLQIIASLLNLQMFKMENEAAKKAIEDSKSRVQSIALMHKGLYQDDNFSQVNIASYIHELVGYQKSLSFSRDKEIQFNLDLDEIFLSIDDAVPLGLIISEFISNSAKHAFDSTVEEPMINIKIKEQNQEITFCYCDNGTGLPENFDLFTDESLGFEIITSLVDQIKGKIEIQSHKPPRFEINFRKANIDK